MASTFSNGAKSVEDAGGLRRTPAVQRIHDVLRGHLAVAAMELDVLAQVERPHQAIGALGPRRRQVRLDFRRIDRPVRKTHQPVVHPRGEHVVDRLRRHVRIERTDIRAMDSNTNGLLRHRRCGERAYRHRHHNQPLPGHHFSRPQLHSHRRLQFVFISPSRRPQKCSRHACPTPSMPATACVSLPRRGRPRRCRSPCR